MRRVVITGLGIVSPIGNNFEEVTDALKAGRSGIAFEPEYAENGFRSRVAGIPKINPAEHIDKRHMRFMGTGAVTTIWLWNRPLPIPASRRMKSPMSAQG